MATHFSTRGNSMDTGTLMVLKRLLITALGALGLGALAAGPAFAQGQIPAPDAYGDPQACAADIKAVAAAAAKKHPLDAGIKAGTASTVNAALNAVMTRACAPTGGDAVGGGIAEARTLYEGAAEAKDDLDTAQKVYDADDSARNLEKLEEAVTAHEKAVAARNDYAGGGAIYEAVYAEEDRKAQAEAASGAWTKAYVAAQKAMELRDTVAAEDFTTQFAGFDENGGARTFEVYERKEILGEDGTTVLLEAATFIRIKNSDGTYVSPDENNAAPAGLVTFDHDDDDLSAKTLAIR